MRGLRPPPAMEPSYRAQLTTLAQVHATGTKLVAALEKRQYARVALLDRSFQQAAAASTSLPVQEAQIAEVTAYDARVKAVDTLVTIYDGSAAIATTTVAPNGTWTYTATLALGAHTLTANQTDTTLELDQRHELKRRRDGLRAAGGPGDHLGLGSRPHDGHHPGDGQGYRRGRRDDHALRRLHGRRAPKKIGAEP